MYYVIITGGKGMPIAVVVSASYRQILESTMPPEELPQEDQNRDEARERIEEKPRVERVERSEQQEARQQSQSKSASQQGSSSTQQPPSFVRQLTNQLQGWLKESNPEVHSKVESAIESATQMADLGLTNAKAAIDMLSEFAGDLTGLESFKVVPKTSFALEVDIVCRQEQDIVVKQQIAPFIELYALHLGKRVNFEALINHSDKGLQLDINDGMSLKILAPLIGIQTVQVKGSGLLTRDEKGQLVLVLTTAVPGLPTPATVSLPMNNFLKDMQTHVHTHISKTFKGER